MRWHLGALGPRWGHRHKSCWELQMEELCVRPWAEHLQGFFLTLSTVCIVSLVPIGEWQSQRPV